jgi:opacity protein-like surface antigen
MTTSGKLIAAAALLLVGTSFASAQSVTNVNDPANWGGGSLGYNAGQNSSLQNTRKYPYGGDPLKAGWVAPVYTVTNVNDPVNWGGGSLGYNAGQNSSLQNTRKYPHGGDPLKPAWEVTLHPHQ